MTDFIKPIPDLPAGFRDASLAGTLIPFIGAGASRLAGCPNWSRFADGALRFFVEQGIFSHAQLDQLGSQNPRVKLSIARGLQREHNLAINFEKILYPSGRDNHPKGRRLYDALAKLGKTFVTTNYDSWLDSQVAAPSPTAAASATASPAATLAPRKNVFYRVDDLTSANLNLSDTVFHLHGSLADPGQMILTTQDYVHHYANDRRTDTSGQENNVLTFLDFLFKERHVLFVGYGLEELEILEYVIVKARLAAEPGKTEMRHFLLQGFFSHEEQLARSLASYYRECGIELVPFLRDQKDWDQLIEIIEEYGRLAPARSPTKVQRLKDMETLLDG